MTGAFSDAGTESGDARWSGREIGPIAAAEQLAGHAAARFPGRCDPPVIGQPMSTLYQNALGTGFPEGDNRAGSTATLDVRWHVLQTKSRQEKALAESMTARGVHCFLPLVEVKRLYNGRRATVELPLFPGYLFLRGTLEEVYSADRTKRVAQVIEVYDQKKLGEELRNVELALRGAGSDAPFDPFPFLKRGIRVEVISGPLRGVRGVIEDRLKRDRLILQVDVLGRATSLEVDSAALAPLGEF